MNELSPTSTKHNVGSEPIQTADLSVLNWVKDLEENDATEFGAITKIASDICGTSITTLGFFDEQQNYFQSHAELTDDDAEHAKNICRKISEDNYIVEYLVRDSRQHYVLCVGVPLISTSGQLIGALCIVNYDSLELPADQRVALETLAKLAASLIELKTLAGNEFTQLRFLEENTSIEIYLVSPSTLKISFANQNARRSLGFDAASAIERDVTETFVAKDVVAFRQQFLDLAVGKISSFSALVEQINKDQSKTLVKIFVSFVREGFDSSILIIAKNISQTGFTSEFVDYLNNYDSITGLGNRRMFETLVSEEIHTSVNSPVESVLLLINVDNFKLLNQSFGYQIGDKIARQVSQILVDNLAADEVLVRTAEDDYCIILPQRSENQIRQKSLELIEKISGEDFSENGKKFKLQVNLGAVMLNSADCLSIDYLSLAHKACEIAREQGQNQFYLFDPEDELFKRKHIEMEQLISIQDAIERNKLVLFAQKIDRVSHYAVDFKEHCEILIRMKGRNGEIISPAAFIPQLETHGSIISLDRWVLNESLKLVDKRFSRLRSRGQAVRMMYNINLSFRSISDVCFVKYCLAKLEEFSHVAPFICFEITETVAISNFEKVKEFIQQIHRFGCTFALDDFGSGGASLEHLKELSMDYIKIDGSFVQDIVENPISQIIVESVCRVAEILGVMVIAEKVETQEVEDKLLTYGVHYIQGFKFHKPSPFLGLPIAETRTALAPRAVFMAAPAMRAT